MAKKIVRHSYSKPRIGTSARRRFDYGERLLTYDTKLRKAREARSARERKKAAQGDNGQPAPDGQDDNGVRKVSRRSRKSISPCWFLM